MKIYWLFLITSLFIYLWSESSFEVVKVGKYYEKRARWIQAFIMFGVIIFFCGLRSGIADTGTYIHMFNGYPNSIDAIEWSEDMKDKGFYFLSVLYKQFISEDFHGWLFLIALVSGLAVMIALKKYSCSFGLSCYLFIASTIFTYLVNGMRQFICVAIIFASTGLIVRRKFIPYLVIVLLLSTIHGSAILMLVVYFIANAPAWSSRMWFVVIMAVGMGVFFDKVFPVLGTLLQETQYSNYVDYIATSGVGSNILRLLIAAVPCGLAFLGRNVLDIRENPVINLSINMSVINLCIYFIATFSSGMAVGRLTTYFDMYNLLLLPWVLLNGFDRKNSRIIILLCMGFYLFFFYFQMVIAWGIGYESDILKIFC